MRKLLIICNTYYQLIVALQCKNKLFTKDYVDIVLSDHSKNCDVISSRLQKMSIFNNVFYLKSKALDYESHKIKELLKGTFGSVFGINKEICLLLNNTYYDELIYYNLNISTISIYSFLCRNNPNIKCSRMEEGILSYNPIYNEKGKWHFSKRIEFIFFVQKLLSKRIIINNCNNFYCFFPELYKGQFVPQGLGLIQDDDIIRKQLSELFEINDSMYLKEKYIFFTSVYDFEGEKKIGEFELVKKVTEFVGKDNLIVKTHPRDTRLVYRENGIHVAEASEVPWEALQLYFGYYDKILLTATSGAIISTNLMVENPIESFFLYRLCDISHNHKAKNTVQTLEELFSNKSLIDRLRTIKVIDKIENCL